MCSRLNPLILDSRSKNGSMWIKLLQDFSGRQAASLGGHTYFWYLVNGNYVTGSEWAWEGGRSRRESENTNKICAQTHCHNPAKKNKHNGLWRNFYHTTRDIAPNTMLKHAHIRSSGRARFHPWRVHLKKHQILTPCGRKIARLARILAGKLGYFPFFRVGGWWCVGVGGGWRGVIWKPASHKPNKAAGCYQKLYRPLNNLWLGEFLCSKQDTYKENHATDNVVCDIQITWEHFFRSLLVFRMFLRLSKYVGFFWSGWEKFQ